MSKVVFSTTLREPLSWANTKLVARDPVEAVREMKDSSSQSMRTIGSLTLCRSLLKAGLVDRYRVVVFPVITGNSGRERIYDGYPDVALDMISSRTFDGRIQLLEYLPTILAGPPGTNGRQRLTSTGWASETSVDLTGPFDLPTSDDGPIGDSLRPPPMVGAAERTPIAILASVRYPRSRSVPKRCRL